MAKIFVSYRQDDAKPWALMLRDGLVETFGSDEVFFDKDTLQTGNWRAQIHRALDQCSVFLVVIGREWLTSTDSHAVRRVDDPDDVHRHEIAVALARKEVTVIPVLVDGASVPKSEDLPEDIRALSDLQGREFGDRAERRRVDMDVLIADVGRATGLTAMRRNASRPPGPFWRFARGLVLATVASVVILVVAELGLGWKLEPPEKSFIVFAVLIITLIGVRLRKAKMRTQP